MTENIWDDSVGEVMKGGQVSFKEAGDFVHGYYKGSEETTGKYGPTFIHKCIGISGSFHDKDGNKVSVLKGMPYTFYDKEFWHDEIMLLLDGQEFALRFDGEATAKAGHKYNTYTLKRLPGMAEVANFKAEVTEDASKPDIFSDAPFGND